ncbi:hypothetical protein HK105_206585 [Polyrhizophydium stewartii]|uniref:Uncharacterized protein n=1 Tax=Polyrhizophydium stewartii TaxID=2732419 RepID=A0ABR4N2S0_9FUNG
MFASSAAASPAPAWPLHAAAAAAASAPGAYAFAASPAATPPAKRRRDDLESPSAALPMIKRLASVEKLVDATFHDGALDVPMPMAIDAYPAALSAAPAAGHALLAAPVQMPTLEPLAAGGAGAHDTPMAGPAPSQLANSVAQFHPRLLRQFLNGSFA